MRVLVVNSGSRSVKLRLVGDGNTVLMESDMGAPEEGSLDQLADFVVRAGGVDAVGHRVVHGGSLFTEPVVVTDAVRRDLDGLNDLAPLHNPPALAGIDAARRLLPEAPSVACFDTAFHAGLPPASSTYAIPADWVARWGIRRYGFHGLSCAWAVGRAAVMVPRRDHPLRVVVCHLGGGASVTASDGGRSIDTTMGFTPLEGLVMATRSGDLDPGALLWALQHGLSTEAAFEDLERRAGLLGLSGGLSSDMRAILDARAKGDEAATLAVSTYVHRLRAKIAAMAAATAGCDVLVFSGGVGENSPAIRADTCGGLGWMEVAIDEAANRGVGAADVDISAAGARVRTLVVHAREELEIAAQCERLLAVSPAVRGGTKAVRPGRKAGRPGGR
jgi:acetate kinase